MLGGSPWGRLPAQLAQDPGENAPRCVRGPAPGIPGMSAWVPQTGGFLKESKFQIIPKFLKALVSHIIKSLF